jgi:hypothetical protein
MNIKDFIKCATSLPNSISILIRGMHGIGKSELVYQLGKHFGLPTIERRLSQMSEGDIIGLPELNNGVTRFCPSDWYKKCCDEPHVLFLDEINRATPEVMQAAFQIVLDRTLNGHTLHPESRIFACVNVNGSYQVNEMDPALLDRFFVVDLEPTVEEWLEYAKPVIHEFTYGFIAANNKMLDPTTRINPGTVQPSRRSWIRHDATLRANGLFDVDFKKNSAAEQHFYCLSVGMIGLEAAIAFTDFVKNIERQVTAEDVLDRWDENQEKIESLGQEKWNIISEKVIDHMTTNVLLEHQAANLGKYFDVIPAELRIVFWTTCAEKHLANDAMDKNIRIMHPFIVKQILKASETPKAPAAPAASTADAVTDAFTAAGATVAPATTKKSRAKKV